MPRAFSLASALLLNRVERLFFDFTRRWADLSLAPTAPPCRHDRFVMIPPETFSHIENIKKRAGHLWRFL